MIGQVLGHYRISAKLGEGGMGVVYRARDTDLDRDVALKLLPAEVGSDPAARARLVEEARLASRLNHPHICTIHEVGQSGTQTYVAMECVEGRALGAQIPAEGLPVELVLRYGAQIADALAHAHEHGIVHRDLKTANVMITPDGRAKVMDFGLAQRLAGKELNQVTRSRVVLTEEKAVAGTLHYLAPEALRGEAADARSDIWALGVVLYEMAAGKLPFDGQTGYELSSAILREPLPSLPPRVPAALRAVIQRCLAKEPGQRYQRAGEVRAALETIGSSDAAIAPAPVPSAEPRPWWRWKPVAGIVAAAALLLALALWKGPSLIGTGRTGAGSSGATLSTGARASANAEANEYFEKAMIFLKQQFDLPRARQMLERALELDPKFAEARAWYGFTYMLMVDSGYSNDAAVLYRAEEELRRALQDDPNSGRVHSALAGVYFHQSRWELVREESEKAYRINPHDVDAKNWLGVYYQMRGENAQARRLWSELLQQDPLFFPARWNLGDLARTEGNYQEAERQLQKILEQDPRNFTAFSWLGLVHLDAGDPAKARAAFEQISAGERQNYWVRLGWTLLYAREGRREEALREMDPAVLKFGEANRNTTLLVAEFYALLRETDKAFEWLDRAVRAGDERLEWFQRDPLLANIRSHPRFKQILDSIAFSRQQRKDTPAPRP